VTVVATTRSRKRRTRSSEPTEVVLPSQEELDRLKLSPEVAWYLLSRGVPLPDCPPLIKTPEPRDAPGAFFDPARVDKILLCFMMLRHTKGRLAGKPLKPDPWQLAYILAPVFGWVRYDDDVSDYVRIISTLYVDLPRKNGKSTIAGGIGIYLTCADGEEGAQVIAAATRLEQAQFVFDPIKQLASLSPSLKPYVKAFKSKIVHRRTGSTFTAIASAGDAQHGADLHGGIVDELHLHKNRDLVEALETGTGSRSQPLIVFITTADAGKRNTPYDEKRMRVEQLARGALTDPSMYGVIWAAEATDDPFAEETWRKANPGYGISPTRRYLREMANKAQDSPAQLASFLRLHLGIRTKQLSRYLELAAWDRNSGPAPIDEDTLAGAEAYGGLDLASVSDLCALCWAFPNAERTQYKLLWRLWTPEDNLEALDKRTAGMASAWVKAGWIKTTPGNVVDYGFLEADIKSDNEKFDVQELAYDRWNSSQLVNNLVEEGVPMVTMGQGYASMSAPTKEVQRLMLTGTEEVPVLEHGGNPAVRWMIDNLAVAMDPAGNVKPDKANSGDKIDAVDALVMAIGRTLAGEAEGDSIYETEDLDIG